MRELGLGLSLSSFRDDLVYTEAALSAHPRTKSLAEPVLRAIGEIEGAESKEREVVRRLTRERARVSVADTELDARVTTFANNLLGTVNQDRTSTLYKKFFPKEPPSVVVRLSFAEERMAVVNMVGEIGKLPPNHPLAVHRQPLSEANEALGEALEERRQAVATVTSFNVDEEETKERVNRLRVGVFAEIQRIGAEEGRDRKWADSFFRARPSRAKADEDDENPVSTPVLPVTPPSVAAPAAPAAPVASSSGTQRTPS